MSQSPSQAQPRTLKLNLKDNVIVAVDSISSGIRAQDVPAAARIPRGHKMAIRSIAKGEPVLKFGQIIGFAGEDIVPGAHVHTHNCGFSAFERDYAFAQDSRMERILPIEEQATFQGFRRANGTAGTRNYIGVITSVNCSATVARFIAEEANRSNLLENYPTVDGVIPLVHSTGCGIDSDGETFEVLKRTTWGYATNPNMAGVLVVGLGCEGFQIARMKDAYGLVESDTFRTMTIQDTGGTKKTIAAGVDAIRNMLPVASKAKRETIPASELMLALQCGGSDGYSGITANVALGVAADMLVKHGGTAVLAETPEIYGAEHLLTRRAANREVGEKLVAIIKWWEDYTSRNKAGGLTTILEKSLGAAAKGGSTTLNAVYHYAEPIKAKGFVYMDTPGYDPVAATGQIAGGCNILCFTTGRGSAYGCKPTPLDQARHQLRRLPPHDRRHGHQLWRCPRRGIHRSQGTGDLRHYAACGLGREV